MTNPADWDTDGDGISDGLEAAASGFSADVQTVPVGSIRVTVFWSDYEMIVETSSSVVGVNLDSTAMRLTVNVSGPDGTEGECEITMPKSLVASASDIKVYLDNQLMDVTITEVGTNYIITATSHHSTHQLLVNFAAGAAGGGGVSGALIGGIAGGLAAVAAAMWLLRRRRRA